MLGQKSKSRLLPPGEGAENSREGLGALAPGGKQPAGTEHSRPSPRAPAAPLTICCDTGTETCKSLAAPVSAKKTPSRRRRAPSTSAIAAYVSAPALRPGRPQSPCPAHPVGFHLPDPPTAPPRPMPPPRPADLRPPLCKPELAGRSWPRDPAFGPTRAEGL